MNNVINKLTLIMPTFNRQSYALRNMRYWSGMGVTLHVLDGTNEALPFSTINNFSNNIHYYHLPLSIHERLKVAISLIKTEYVAMLGDDEFYLATALISCIRELDKNSELVACIGRCMGFDVINGEISGDINYPLLKNHSLLHDDPNERMFEHMATYVPSTIYSIVRTPIWCKAMSVAVHKEFSLDSFDELAFELVVSHSGKSKVISELSWLRSHETLPIRLVHLKNEVKIPVSKWLRDPSFEKERDEYFKVIASKISKNENNYSIIIENLKKALFLFGNKDIPNTPMRIIILNKILPYINKNIKSVVKQFIKIISPNYFKEKISFLEMALQMASKSIIVNLDELNKIKLIIEEFHAKKEKSF